MARNLELKIKLNSHSKVLSIIKKNNIPCEAILKQKDTYYKIKNGLLKLRNVNGRFELIKYLRDEKGKKRWSDYEILHIEGKDPEAYLAQLFPLDTVVEKKRMLYIVDGTRIHLDTVKGLGKFLELETVVTNGLKDAEKRFNKTVELLKLDPAKQIKTSYKFLIGRK